MPQPFNPLFPSGLQAAIDKAIATIPPDKRGKVEIRVTLQGVELETAIRIAKGLEVAAFAQRANRQNMAGAKLKWTF